VVPGYWRTGVVLFIIGAERGVLSQQDHHYWYFMAQAHTKVQNTQTSSKQLVKMIKISRITLFVALTALSWCPTCWSVEEEESYGVDVSFPIHRRVSTNFAWLKHNTDPTHNDVPTEYKDMPMQPLGDRLALYVKHVEGCRKYYADDASQCDENEYNRMLMNLRQPQSMQVSCSRTQRERERERAFMILFLYISP
jgi:hypothetical protein